MMIAIIVWVSFDETFKGPLVNMNVGRATEALYRLQYPCPCPLPGIKPWEFHTMCHGGVAVAVTVKDPDSPSFADTSL